MSTIAGDDLAERGAAAPFRVLVVEDHDYVREGLIGLLNEDDELVVVGSAASAADALPLVSLLQPDVLVSDVRLPGMDGYELCRRLNSGPNPVPVLLTTSFTGNGDVDEAREAGASGYIDKEPDPQLMRRAVRAVASGSEFCDSRVPRGSARPRMTSAQRRVLQLLPSELTYREMGQRLHVSENTIKGHVKEIFTKLDVHSRVEAVAQAYQAGLIDRQTRV